MNHLNRDYDQQIPTPNRFDDYSQGEMILFILAIIACIVLAVWV